MRIIIALLILLNIAYTSAEVMNSYCTNSRCYCNYRHCNCSMERRVCRRNVNYYYKNPYYYGFKRTYPRSYIPSNYRNPYTYRTYPKYIGRSYYY